MCGKETVIGDAESVLGFKRHRADVPEALAVAVALRVPGDAPPGSR